MSLRYVWNVIKFREALPRDGAYLLRSNQAGWSGHEFWETYIQLTIVELAFRTLDRAATPTDLASLQRSNPGPQALSPSAPPTASATVVYTPD